MTWFRSTRSPTGSAARRIALVVASPIEEGKTDMGAVYEIAL
jgi:hypothetical protein